jgi:hypothetical protein
LNELDEGEAIVNCFGLKNAAYGCLRLARRGKIDEK